MLKTTPYHLSIYQKRQCALINHFMSLDYYQGLLDRLNALIGDTDANLQVAQKQKRDQFLGDPQWGQRNTSANWSNNAFPALLDFRQSVLRQMAMRSSEAYAFTDANNCSRKLSEFSYQWMTPDEKKAFDVAFEKVCKYAALIDDVTKRRQDDATSQRVWPEFAHLFPRLPRFRVHPDIIGRTGEHPPRTGLYVPAADPYGAVAFAWRGNGWGKLDQVHTANAFGKRVMQTLGRGDAWQPTAKVCQFATEAFHRNEIPPGDYPATLEEVIDPVRAPHALSFPAFEQYPTTWYFVETIEGEFDDEPTSIPTLGDLTAIRCEADHPCPRAGFWSSPHHANSRRRFAAGVMMPHLSWENGATIWHWDDDAT